MTSPNELARKAAHEAQEDGQREIITRILELRNGPLTPTVTNTIAQADSPQLETWVTEIIANQTPNELR